MANQWATNEQYIEHEVKIRVLQQVNEEKFKNFEQLVDNKFDNMEKSISRIDNKVNWMFTLYIGSVILPIAMRILRLY